MLWVLISRHASLWILIGVCRFFRSLCVLMDSDGSLYVRMGLFRSLCVLMDSNGFLCVIIVTDASF